MGLPIAHCRLPKRATLLTAPGMGEIALIRLSGGSVADFLEQHFSKRAMVGRCVYGELRDGGDVIDDVVVVLCDETTVDMNVHGGAWVVNRGMELARAAGFEFGEEWPGGGR